MNGFKFCPSCRNRLNEGEEYCSQCGIEIPQPLSQSSSQSLQTKQGIKVEYQGRFSYSGFWRRVLAYLIDAIVLGLAFGILKMGLSESGAKLLSFVGGWLYFAYLESSIHQATFGKMLFSAKVVDYQGNRISFGTATIRHFSKFISAIILLIGFIMVAFTQKKQGLHDILAGTLVINKK